MKLIQKNILWLLLLAGQLSGAGLWAQGFVVSGQLLDEQNEPIVAATIVIKGTANYTITDQEGRFSLKSETAPPFTLRSSFVGYAPQETVVTSEKLAQPLTIKLQGDLTLAEVVVTSRRRSEEVQEIPIAVSVVTGDFLDDAGAFNVNRVKELVPTVQLYSSNPRNTTLNIRGLGSTFGLTNDGIDPGVGFYVDGVYYARPAVTTLDFIDIEQIEVLRGPQGTLFGKNTTAGAFNITTRRPSFESGFNFESSFGNYGFVQAKTSLTGALSNKLAARLSFSGTQRNGVIQNVATNKAVNDLNNLGLRGQLLFVPNSRLEILLAADYSTQRPDGYAQVYAGVTETRRPAYRQFNQIISDLNYTLPSTNPFDRIIDHDTPWRSDNDLGGVSLNIDAKIGQGMLTSTTAWRYWNWGPSNDRDFTGLQGLRLSQAPSRHNQWSQEVRYAGDFGKRLSGVLGVYTLWQDLRATPYHTEEAGRDQWRFSQSSTSPLWATPGLLDGYGTRTRNRLESFSGAVFAQLDWGITDRLHFLPGIRYNYDEKAILFDREVYGGLQTTDPALIALQRSVYNEQSFEAFVSESNFSGQVTLAYRLSERFNTFATYSTSFKPVGINLGGLPRINGETAIDLARIEPEYVSHFEVGIKTKPSARSTFNIVYHNTDISNFQTLVQTPDLSVNRGYLANAERVNVWGIELDAQARVNRFLTAFGSLAYTDGRYVKFTNAPVPLEETGGETFKDISGGALPGISRWAASLGGEVSHKGRFLGYEGKFFLAADGFYRSGFSSSPSPSQVLNVDGYALVNARVGFRGAEGLSIFVWSRNLLNQDYFEFLLPGAGNVGHYAGVLGDPQTYGITLRYTL
ncbi:TonB-dependent receptor [Eisenibacter elegans]|uniref:TonB-dependent receptor n=1 Tax=Eisenibacter elegans TaxID=997 RepID=UPI000401E79F|nr:TonB-dependent receptor [Eisenibacter elegans]